MYYTASAPDAWFIPTLRQSPSCKHYRFKISSLLLEKYAPSDENTFAAFLRESCVLQIALIIIIIIIIIIITESWQVTDCTRFKVGCIAWLS